MKRSTRQVNIFLIYAHRDQETVRKLHQRLIRDGINAWLDAQNLQLGQDWQHEIRRAILNCDLVLACLTREFAKQPGYRHEELKIALEKAKFLQLRWLLIEASWMGVRKDPVLMEAFQQFCKRMRKTKAIIKIARKLLNRVRYVLKNQAEYVTGVVE